MLSNELLPTIAIVIPNHNDATCLPDCLHSVLGQSVQPDQIIFVDDHSSDNSQHVAQQILESTPSAILRSNSRCLGTMGTLNEGLRYATCDYVLFLSSNDFLGDDLIKTAKESMARLGRPGVWSAMVWDVNDDETSLTLHNSPALAATERFFSAKECIRLAHSIGNWFNGTTMLFNRELLLQICGLDPEYQGLADWLAALTASSLRGAIFCPCPFGVVRNHAGGYLWRTLDDRTHLERILQYMCTRGPALSPKLFTKSFVAAMKSRIRYISLRQLAQDSWPHDLPEWQRGRYNIIKKLRNCLTSKKTLNFITFLLLRPKDVIPTFWYKYLFFSFLCRTTTFHPHINFRNCAYNDNIKSAL